MPEKLVSRAIRPPRAASVSMIRSAGAGSGRRAESARSAPSNARAWPRTESRRLSVNEPMATSAATPTATDAVRSSRRRGAARISRAAMRSTNVGPIALCGRVGDDLAVGQANRTPGPGGELEIVGDEDQRRAEVPVELRHEVDDRGAGACVEIAGGLVGEEHLGPSAEGAGQGDALLLATGELSGIVVAAVAQAHSLEQLAGARGRRFPSELERHLHIFAGGERRNQLE